MKFYKVIKESIKGVVLGNSEKPLHDLHPLYSSIDCIKVDDDGRVYNLNNTLVYAQHQTRLLQLVLKPEELSLFVEIEEPGPKILSNFRFVVKELDWDDGMSEISEHPTMEEAAAECSKLNTANGNYYSEFIVTVDYDSANAPEVLK